ncbi:MAG: LptF/LptG family permease [Muribaculaceae bacterium]|nr:LptF/LptG family permease [Muribaculaceae bacterium]
MFRIKRLYTFMLQTFLPLLLMTFLITLFIVLMQFLWKFIDQMVGKGLTIGVLGELFFYAALTFVPMALPLAILLASLMTFGNLGERFELTAMKASGISLLRTMRPLIISIALIAIGAFFFQNNVLPIAQTKMWTLFYSIRQKSPEVEIPEGVFYDQIPGYNLYVEKKDRETGTLHTMMIYDVSKGFENARIILADSGRMSITEDKTHLFLRLWDGEQFENLRESNGGASKAGVPYRRESFDIKEILVPFDANFNRLDEAGMRNQFVGKDLVRLRQSIDSINRRVDSIGNNYADMILNASRLDTDIPSTREMRRKNPDPHMTQAPSEAARNIDIDSLLSGKGDNALRTSILQQALAKAKRNYQDYEFKSMAMEDDRKNIRRHEIELMKKFTLSFACLIFFFIGAPLGAIIRKGGLGTPIVISVLLFIAYYIIDNSGYKLARDGRWEVWQGIWLSSAVLLPLGIFLTYKAVNDSAVFNADAYKIFFRRLSGKMKREMTLKEVFMNDIDPATALQLLEAFYTSFKTVMHDYDRSNIFRRMWLRLCNIGGISSLQGEMNRVIVYLSDANDAKVIHYLNRYPFDVRFNKKSRQEIENATLRLIEIFSRQQNQ